MAYYTDRNGEFNELPANGLYERMAVYNAVHTVDIKENSGLSTTAEESQDQVYNRQPDLPETAAIDTETERPTETRSERHARIIARFRNRLRNRENISEDGIQQRRVVNFMEKPSVVVHQDIKVVDAWLLFKKHGLHFIPVVDSNHKFKGLISDRGLLFHIMEIADENGLDGNIKDFLMDKVPTTSPDTELREAALSLIKSKVGALTVLDDQKHVVGMLYGTGMLKTMLMEKRPLNVSA